MKRVLIFIFPILLTVAAGFVVFGVLQVRYEQEKLLSDLARKAQAVAESVALSARGAIRTGDLKTIRSLAESFQRRERMQGCVIYDNEGNVLGVTERVADWGRRDKATVQRVLATQQACEVSEKLADYSVYSYLVPVLDEAGNPLGVVQVMYETSYMFTTLAEIWKRLSIALLGLLILISLTAILIERQMFSLPVRRLTQWFGHFQRGETDQLRPFPEKGEFGKLVSEVEQVALGLRVARRAVSDEASARVQKDETWTDDRLKDLVRARLGEKAFYVISNREPYMHVREESTGKPTCIRPAGGVVTAIDPLLQACGGTWIAHGSASADHEFVNAKDKLGVPPEDNRYILKRVWLTKEE